jgi:hypothetical protein
LGERLPLVLRRKKNCPKNFTKLYGRNEASSNPSLIDFGAVNVLPERSLDPRAVLVESLQGCQMAYFQTKNPNLGKFWRVLKLTILVYFYFITISFILQPLGIFCGHWDIL